MVDSNSEQFEETLEDLQIKLERVNAYVQRSEMRMAKFEKELAKLREIKREKELKKLLTLEEHTPMIIDNEQ